MPEIHELLEITMILCFGVSWPLNVIKAYKARTAKGSSLAFLCFIFFGYVAGITGKLLNEAYMAEFSSKWYVLIFYVINFIMVATNIVIYFRNVRLDKKKASENT